MTQYTVKMATSHTETVIAKNKADALQIAISRTPYLNVEIDNRESTFNGKVQASTKINTEGYKSFDKTNHNIATNRSGDGITISKGGQIRFQKILADDLADQLGFLEIMYDKDEFSDTNKILLRVNDGLSEVDIDEDWLNYQKSKRAFSGLKLLRAIITDHGSDELKSRWIPMFDDVDDLQANSYAFTEDSGLVRDGNLFEIDLMFGEGNNQGRND